MIDPSMISPIIHHLSPLILDIAGRILTVANAVAPLCLARSTTDRKGVANQTAVTRSVSHNSTNGEQSSHSYLLTICIIYSPLASYRRRRIRSRTSAAILQSQLHLAHRDCRGSDDDKPLMRGIGGRPRKCRACQNVCVRRAPYRMVEHVESLHTPLEEGGFA